jgi:hypothetical protein
MKTLEQKIKEAAYGNGKDGIYPPLAVCIVKLGPRALTRLVEEHETEIQIELVNLENKIYQLEMYIKDLYDERD